jgi:HEAT repeat protein
MSVTNRTGDTASYTSHLCAELPVGRITCKDTRQVQGLDPKTLVQQLRELRPILPAGPPASAEEERKENLRQSIYEELLDWGAASIPPLVDGLRDPDVGFRRNVTLAFMAVGGGWWPFECGTARLDIRSALPALVAAFRDSDSSVRSWAAQAVGDSGEGAASAVPALIGLLDGDEGSRNSACIALGNIGPAAKAALPALRRALHDSSPDVQRFAARAIEKIER